MQTATRASNPQLFHTPLPSPTGLDPKDSPSGPLTASWSTLSPTRIANTDFRAQMNALTPDDKRNLFKELHEQYGDSKQEEEHKDYGDLTEAHQDTSDQRQERGTNQIMQVA